MVFLQNFEYHTKSNIFKSLGFAKIKDNRENNYEFSQIYIDTEKKEILGTDVKAFINSAKKNDVNFSILETVDLSNEIRPNEIVEKIINLQPFDSSSTICFLGLTFKPNTNDIRDSTSIKIAKLLNEK